MEIGIPPICTVSGRTVNCKADVPTGRQFVEYEWTWTPTSGRKSTRTNTNINNNYYSLASSPSGKLEIHAKYDSSHLSPKQVFQISTDNDDFDIDWDNVLYGPIVCTDYSTTQNANYYLDMSSSDPGNCPPPGMFRSSTKTGYIPVLGYEKNVAKVYGKVIVRQDGQCSRWPDTGMSYDFQIPCRAHDYCYDLRRAGFAGTVTDEDCDSRFDELMEAHCDNRLKNQRICGLNRNTFHFFVTISGVTAGDHEGDPPVPGKVEIRNTGTDKCAAVRYSQPGIQRTIHLLEQQNCGVAGNKLFYIYPAPDPAVNAGEYDFLDDYYQIRPANATDRCLEKTSNSQFQSATCNKSEKQLFEIRGGTHDQYTIRSKSHLNSCWKVSGTNLWTAITNSTNCNSTDGKSVWRINDAD